MTEPETLPAATVDEVSDVSLPVDIKTVFLGGIFLLLLLTLIHAASSIVIPVVLAFIMKLVLQPVLRLVKKWGVPKHMAAALILIALVSGIIGMGTILAGPATEWGKKLPENFPQLQERLEFLTKPMQITQKFLVQADNLSKGPGQKVVAVELPGSRLSDKVFAVTQLLVSGLFTTMLVLFFLLASDDIFLRRLVEVLPTFQNKRQAVDISQQIERDLSRYLLTITTINAVLGMVTALVFWLFHVEDPVLWGTLAFLLNYVPIIGPMIATIVFFLVGLMVIHGFWGALLPAIFYLIIHLLESMIVTPLLLARRFTLNPVLVILALIFWYWMWGFIGAILAMPMLAITKIICDRVQGLSAFGHFLEG